MVVSNNTNTEEKTRLWIAVVLLSITLARLAFHLRIVAALLVITSAVYGMQRWGYDMWLRATKQNSVMSP